MVHSGAMEILASHWLSALATACSLLALAVVASRTPSAHAKRCNQITLDNIKKWETECELMRATQERWTAEFNGIADRCNDDLERAETKRRRSAASESRNRPAPVEGDPWQGMSRDEIVTAGRRARMGRTQ